MNPSPDSSGTHHDPENPRGRITITRGTIDEPPGSSPQPSSSRPPGVGRIVSVKGGGGVRDISMGGVIIGDINTTEEDDDIDNIPIPSDDDFDDDPMEDEDEPSIQAERERREEITNKLATSGPTGMAAAAAISSTMRSPKSRHTFETNPSMRKRQQTRILRKLKQNIEEYSQRVGQQACVIVATPGKSNKNFRAFGAKPLEDVLKNLQTVILTELETALSRAAPPREEEDPNLHELPPIAVDGIPTPVDKMTQAQLRAFIPLMLKYSTGRGKPGWGKESTKPPWWPAGVPWANVRMDARTDEEKMHISWTLALRQIVINCYKFHGREDLMPASTDDDGEQPLSMEIRDDEGPGGSNLTIAMSQPQRKSSNNNFSENFQRMSAKDKTEAIGKVVHRVVQRVMTSGGGSGQAQAKREAKKEYQSQQQTVVHTISNGDGTVSIIHVDPSNPIITLPDGTQAQIVRQGGNEDEAEGGDGNSVHTLATVAAELQEQQQQQQTIEITGDLTTTPEGHLLLTTEDGQTYQMALGGGVTPRTSNSGEGGGGTVYQAIPVASASGNQSGIASLLSAASPRLSTSRQEVQYFSIEGNQIVARKSGGR